MDIHVANRIKRLPPYTLGTLKKLVHERRRGGEDVIDMNMGNPADPPARPRPREDPRGSAGFAQ